MQQDRKREEQIRMFGVLQGPSGTWHPPGHPRTHFALQHKACWKGKAWNLPSQGCSEHPAAAQADAD